MRILLTGSSGWLGRHLAPRLIKTGHEVTGLDVAKGKYTTVLGSVCDAKLVQSLFAESDIEVVIHSAALHKPDIARFAATDFVDVNVKGTLNLLEASAAAKHDRFIFTSTTSLMITKKIRAGVDGGATAAYWLNENSGPLCPRNIYGATKLAAEHLCHLYSDLHNLDIAILRTSRFFPEDDDTLKSPHGANLKANEFLNRRLDVSDAADAHIVALNSIQGLNCKTYILSAPTPFRRADCRSLATDAAAVILRYFPRAGEIYERHGWRLPDKIERVYDSSLVERELGFRPTVDFASVLYALESGDPLPFQHLPDYESPINSAT